jgi:hypothetical protein
MSVGGDHLKESICLLVFNSCRSFVKFCALFIHLSAMESVPRFFRIMPFVCPPTSVIHSFIHSFVHSFIRSFVHSFVHSFTHSFIHSFKHAVTKIFVRIGFQRSDFPTSYLLHNIAAPGRSNNIFRAIADGTGKRWRAWRMNGGTGCF